MQCVRTDIDSFVHFSSLSFLIDQTFSNLTASCVHSNIVCTAPKHSLIRSYEDDVNIYDQGCSLYNLNNLSLSYIAYFMRDISL